MIRSTTALLCGAFLLTSCGSDKLTTTTPTDEPRTMCVAGYVEDSPGKGTLDIFAPTEYSPKVQSIPEVSVTVAEEITAELGLC